MASQIQVRPFSTSLSSYFYQSSFTPSLSSRDIKQEKGIGEEDWIIAEDGGPTSFQPPRPETPLADGLPRSFQSHLGKPCRGSREPLSQGENNVGYIRITDCTNSCSSLVSISINRDIHRYSNDCSCFSCEDERDTIPDTPNTRRLPANPIVSHEFSVNCPCLSCEDRREETLGSPSTRQQPNLNLDLVPPDSTPVVLSPELLSPPLPPTSLSQGKSQDREGFFYDDVRIENHGRLASPESALPIQPRSAVRVAPAISEIRRNPSRRAKEEALVRIRECLGKKIGRKSRALGRKSSAVRDRRMQELISPSSTERELTKRITQKHRHFQSFLDILEQDVIEHQKENGYFDLAWSKVASPHIVSYNETSGEDMEGKHKIMELGVAFKFITYT